MLTLRVKLLGREEDREAAPPPQRCRYTMQMHRIWLVQSMTHDLKSTRESDSLKQVKQVSFITTAWLLQVSKYYLLSFDISCSESTIQI